MSLKDNWVFSTKILTNCGVYNICRSQMYDNSNVKVGKRNWEYTFVPYTICEVVNIT